MKYPTIEEVNNADRITICRWYRFLKPPGSEVVEDSNFYEVLDTEVKIMNRIHKRFNELGGMTPKISEEIGWLIPIGR